MNKITIREAAKITGKSEQFLRVGLQLGKLPFGTAINMTGKRWTYIIYPEKFKEYIGG